MWKWRQPPAGDISLQAQGQGGGIAHSLWPGWETGLLAEEGGVFPWAVALPTVLSSLGEGSCCGGKAGRGHRSPRLGPNVTMALTSCFLPVLRTRHLLGPIYPLISAMS